MSSYSLTLQHGVPFRPVNIRVSSDPISLIEKILAQNPGSYAKLQDLVSIGKNLVAAGLTIQNYDDEEGKPQNLSTKDIEDTKDKAQRRVIGMAIESALQEDDFETAYSYVVNSLDTSSATSAQTASSRSRAGDDDVAWRAALAAGRHKSPPSSQSASQSVSATPALRRLEQRMDLLSQALLLSPPSALPEILSAWRKCEEEMTALLASEAQEESEFANEPASIPGAFLDSAPPVHARREVGRGANEEAPMGLFDVARGAAQAFSRSAFPLRGAQPVAAGPTVGRDANMGGRPASIIESDAGSEGGDGTGRVRKRDMVANAVTGGLASGIGWVLGK
jgi:protein transport protein SEC39